MKKLFLQLFIVILWGLGACLAASASSAPMQTVASIFPVADMIKQVGQDRLEVRTLLPPGASPHTFEPTPQQMIGLSKARLFIKIGAGLEFWAERLLKAASSTDLMILDLSQGMPLLYGIHRHAHEHDAKKASPAGEGGADPHYWLDPVLAQKMVERIAQQLIKMDSAHAMTYLENAKRYNADLDGLHQEIKAKVKEFRTREYVTFHPAWNYFSRRYGLRVIGVIEEAPGREPSPRDIARMVKELKKFKTRIVFAEPQFNPKIAHALAKEVGGKVLFLDPLGDPNHPEKSSYLKLMRYNLSQMERLMR